MERVRHAHDERTIDLEQRRIFIVGNERYVISTLLGFHGESFSFFGFLLQQVPYITQATKQVIKMNPNVLKK